MTAMRMGGIATITAAVLAAASLLWQTEVPDDLVLRATQARPLPGAERAEEYARGLRLLWAGGTAGQVLLLGALVLRWRPRRAFAALAAILAAAWLAGLPFRAGAHAWRRRYGTTDQGYLDWLLTPWAETIGTVALLAAGLAAGMALARRLGPRWWLAGGPALAALGTAAILFQPLVFAPRLEPLRDGSLVRAIDAGMPVEVKRVSDRTSRISAEAAGIGPSRRIILWDTLLDGTVPRGEILLVAAHELAHVEERHLWKGLAWFALLATPLAWVVARATQPFGSLASPAAVPAAALVVVLLQLGFLPVGGAISRRYEAEADWLALAATRDPAAAEGLFRRFVVRNLADPDAPRGFATHPAILERIAMAQAFAATRGREPPAGS